MNTTICYCGEIRKISVLFCLKKCCIFSCDLKKNRNHSVPWPALVKWLLITLIVKDKYHIKENYF